MSPESGRAKSRRSAGGGRGVGRGRLRTGVLTTLLKYELKMLLRDRRTIIVSVLLPVLLFPLIILVMNWVEERRERELETRTYSYALTGSRSGYARDRVEDALTATRPAAAESAATASFEEKSAVRPDSLLRTGELDLLIEGMTAEEYRSERSGQSDRDSLAVEALDLPADFPVIRLDYRSDRDVSVTARRRMQELLSGVREARLAELLRSRGLPVDPDRVAAVETENVASREKESGALVGLLLTPLLVLLMMTGGSVVAADAISGEKERGTLETLLTTAARRGEIVAAKQLAIIAVGLAIAVINIVNLLIYVVIGLFELPADFRVPISAPTLLVLFFLFLPLTALVSSALLLVSGYSKSYREYQIYFFPVFLVFVVPSLAAILPGIDLRSAIALVPVANISVAVREVLIGEFDWVFLGLTFAATTGAAAYLARLTSRTLNTEKLITAADVERAELTGGPALFRKRVLRWFGLIWVALFVSSLWLGGDLGIRGQVVFNLVGLFLGGSILMIWRYRLNLKEALALRPVRPPVWMAVLIGAPSALAVGQGVARLAQFVFPVPERAIESFSQFLLPETLPLWQVVFFLAVLPGVIEEIAFRGVLLHGLRRRFSPAVLCLIVGGIFGLFHLQLFRLIPTAYLGAVLTAVVLFTGSIFPAMLWHAVNNAVGLVPVYLGLWEGDVPTEVSALGVVGLAVAFWILWRYRTPYPGLRDGPVEAGDGPEAPGP